MLMDSSISAMYPIIEGNTSNFVDDYLLNHVYLDKVFHTKFMSKKALFVDGAAFPSIYNEWLEECKAFVVYYLDSWARLYYALNEQYNPLYNVDGVTTTHTEGTTEDRSGQDQNNVVIGEVNATTITEPNEQHTNDYTVPTDTGDEKKTNHTSVEIGELTSTHNEEERTNINTTVYGSKNDVDFTVTEKRQGNIGVTKSSDLLLAEWDLRKRAFFDMVFDTLSKELTIW